MKRTFCYSLIMLLLFTVSSCVPRTVSQMSGYGDYGYLIFVGTNTKNQKVSVIIDTEAPFVTKAVGITHSNRKGDAHLVKSGKHRVTVSYDGKIIAIKDLIINAQETQTIQLP